MFLFLPFCCYTATAHSDRWNALPPLHTFLRYRYYSVLERPCSANLLLILLLFLVYVWLCCRILSTFFLRVKGLPISSTTSLIYHWYDLHAVKFYNNNKDQGVAFIAFSVCIYDICQIPLSRTYYSSLYVYNWAVIVFKLMISPMP